MRCPSVTRSPSGTRLMIDTESVERAASFWYLACEAIYNAMPQASLQKRPSGMRVLRTGAKTSILNGIISTTHEPDPDELSSLATSYSGSALPWSIQLRDDSVPPAAGRRVGDPVGPADIPRGAFHDQASGGKWRAGSREPDDQNTTGSKGRP